MDCGFHTATSLRNDVSVASDDGISNLAAGLLGYLFDAINLAINSVFNLLETCLTRVMDKRHHSF